MICCTVGSVVLRWSAPALGWSPASSVLALLLAGRASPALDERRKQDTRLVEQVQRDRLEQQRDRVARQERGDGRAGHERVAAVCGAAAAG